MIFAELCTLVEVLDDTSAGGTSAGALEGHLAAILQVRAARYGTGSRAVGRTPSAPSSHRPASSAPSAPGPALDASARA